LHDFAQASEQASARVEAAPDDRDGRVGTLETLRKEEGDYLSLKSQSEPEPLEKMLVVNCVLPLSA
jgi:hypothetical protein